MMLRTYEELKQLVNPSEEEFLLIDRLQKIESTINRYGEENFYISFSGGKDSTVLSALIDLALPNNKIPRVYANTGIELNMVRDYVFELAKKEINRSGEKEKVKTPELQEAQTAAPRKKVVK